MSYPQVCDGRSSFDIVLPAPTITELEVVEELFQNELIEGETYMGPRWPVMLMRWDEREEVSKEYQRG